MVYLVAFVSHRITTPAFAPAIIDLILALLFLEYLVRTEKAPGITQN